MALSPNVPVVAPGDLITSAHINNIRSNLDRLDTTKVLKAGDTMTGALVFGVDPTAGQGIQLRPDIGTILAAKTGGAGSAPADPNVFLGRGGTASAANAVYVTFRASPGSSGTPMLTVIGTITSPTTSSIAYNTTSDGRLKDVVGDVDDPLDVIGRLHPVVYRWKSDPDVGEFAGFIAQEVADVVPTAVTGDPAGDVTEAPMQLNASALIPFLVGAVQALAARVAALEAA